MFTLGIPALDIILRSVVVYVALFAALRIFGKREVGQFTLYDLVFVLLVANAVQPAMTGPDSSLSGGLIIVVTLAVINFGMSRLAHVRLLRHVFAAQATIIIREGAYVTGALKREGLEEDECDSAIREHGLGSVKDVHLGVLEPDGSISIVPKDAPGIGRSRRVRRRFRVH